MPGQLKRGPENLAKMAKFLHSCHLKLKNIYSRSRNFHQTEFLCELTASPIFMLLALLEAEVAGGGYAQNMPAGRVIPKTLSSARANNVVHIVYT